MALLRKPGKLNYKVPKAYHPIALLCTIPKVLTAIVAEDISHMVEKGTLLPDTHFGGWPGHTTMDAIYYLVGKSRQHGARRGLPQSSFWMSRGLF